MEKKGWERIKNRLPDTHEWGYSKARREKKRGRAKEGFLIGKRKDWGDINGEVGTVVEEGILVSKIRGKEEGKDITIMSVYNTEGWKVLEMKIKELMEEGTENCVMIGGNSNIRIGERGGLEEEGEEGRKSKGKIIGNNGMNLLDLIGEIGGYIMNGVKNGDKEGELCRRKR